ncbi:MAG: T9SS type A sorting domain-containing protein [Flavobacteriales bacterium]|nr:T9SS type A sorting domain-containing protein [Flavobacteriales bacterium]
MKKLLLALLVTGLSSSLATAQWNRYLDEVFTDVDVTTDVQFGTNWNFLLGSPTPNFTLNTDIYSPAGDSETGRAAVIVLHTGNFLPKYLNQSATGNNRDSSVVVSAELFAKRGYVAFAPAYRLGWNATTTDPVTGADVRRGTLITAVYRAINDVKSLVRYIKKSVAEDGNPYGIDPDKIIVYGHGSGGYISLAYGSLDRLEELENEASGKWLSTVDVAQYGYVANELYLNTAAVGGIEGFGGIYNDSNHYGYTNDVMACVNVGGALGDSAWMEVGEPPIISFHCPDDGFAPFTEGIVIVPTTQETVVDVVGSRWAIGRANDLGNNDALYHGKVFNDPYTLAAEAALASSHPDLGLDPANYKGLFPFLRPTIAWPFQESSPWDWWDEATVVASASPLVGATAAQAIHDNGIGGSPTMSAMQGKAYLDSIQGYLAPRLRELMMQDVSVEETDFVNSNMFVYPNPANDYLVVKTNEGIRITDVEIYDVTGKIVRTENGLNKLSHQINVNEFTSGLYLVKVTTDQGMITRKVFVD